MNVEFKKLREVCPAYNRKNGYCKSFRFGGYDCNENNCPLNAAQNKGTNAAQTNSCIHDHLLYAQALEKIDIGDAVSVTSDFKVIKAKHQKQKKIDL